MKRVHFISILAALLVAGCSEETHNSLLTENMITFSEHGSDTFASSTRGVAGKNMSQQSQVFKLETGNVGEAPLYLIATTEDYASSPQTQQRGTTRGTEVTTFGSFGWFALDGTSAVYENSVATSAGSVFTTGEYWPADLLATPSKTYGFLAYYPRLTSTSYGLTLDASARTITYDATSASVAVADQQDLMAAFTTRGYNGGDAVPLEFKHLCTAVKIKTAKDFTHTVKRVVFKNIFTTGVCSLTSTAPYHIWNATVQSTDYEVYDDATGVTGGGKDVLTGSSTLFMIPQSFTSSNQMIEVVINDGTTDHTLTTTLNGSEWIAGKVVTYTISRSAIVALTSLTVEYPLWKNSSDDNVYGPVFRYEGDDYFGLFAVDNSTNEIVRSNVKVGVSFGSTTATCNLAGIEPQRSDGYTYYIMYPYRESVPDGLAVGATFSGSTADEFFSSVISGWNPSEIQNTLAMHKAQDLQVSKVVINERKATAKMAHMMGLAKVVLGTKSVTTSEVRTYSTQSTTHNVYTTESGSTDVTATSKLSDETAKRLLDAAALTGDGGLWTIVKPSGTAVTLNSVSDDDDAWANSISVSGISAGHYQEYTAQSKRTGTVPLSLVANFQYNSDKTYYKISLAPGTYKLEVWGAQGGDGRIWNQNVEVPGAGGKGGYTTGILTLESTTTLYVCIGGKGEKAFHSKKIDGTNNNYKPLGGYNGGGTGGTEQDEPVPENAAGGGGATHIASTLQGSGVLADYVQHKSDVLIVAGGGGGAAGDFPVNYQEIYEDNTGDISTTGNENLAKYGLEDNPRASLQALYGGEGGSIGAGTTYHFGNSSVTANICGVIPCSCPGVADNGDDRFFGKGQEGSTYRGNNIGGTGGGGGGWYGGTYGGNHKNAVSAGGAGGSGHVSSRLTNRGGTVGARSGDGFARITKLK